MLQPGWGFEELEEEREAVRVAFGDNSGYLLGRIPAGSTVIPRFRALPFGRELEAEVALAGSELLNSYEEHRFAGDMGRWYPVFEGLTPRSWRGVENLPVGEEGPFFVKGETNSRRQLWATHSYAETRRELGSVIANLVADSLIGHQDIWIREFVDLNIIGRDVSGMPTGEEYRVFFLDGVELARGFYWRGGEEHFGDFVPRPEEIDHDLVAEVGERLLGNIRFCAVDFARCVDDSWIVVEINDGCMSGLCGVDAFELWRSVAYVIENAAPGRRLVRACPYCVGEEADYHTMCFDAVFYIDDDADGA